MTRPDDIALALLGTHGPGMAFEFRHLSTYRGPTICQSRPA